MKKHVYFILFWCLQACAITQASNTITKAFFHEGSLRDRVVLQFAREAAMNELPTTSNSVGEVTFFIPDVRIDSREAQAMLDKINRTKKNHFSVSVSATEKPKRGLLVKISYRPDLVAFSYGRFDSITTQKCITFHFDDKHKLDALEKKSKPLQTMANVSKPKVMLDYGHGGSDNGKVGCHGIKEKHITVTVGNKVKALLQQKGYDVLLTRSEDVFVPLDQRTSIANAKRADLFVSLHANAAHKKEVTGLETYWAGQHLVREVLPGDARINKLSFTRDQRSKQLAVTVHQALLSEVRVQYPLVDRKVKMSAGQVLYATDMPSILIEMGFLSNPDEARTLSDERYQAVLAQGISKGIDTFYTKYVRA